MRAGLRPVPARTGRAVAVDAVARAPRRATPSSSASAARSSKRSDPTNPANGAIAASATASASSSATAGMANVVIRPAPAFVLSRAPAAVVEAPAKEDATATPTFDADTSRDGWHRDGSFRVAMSPRPHEIDEFGVVNNTYYNTFMYAARYRYLSELGVSIAALQARGVVSVTVRVNTTFRTPLRLSDAFYATSAVRSVARSQLVLAEAVRRRSDDAVVALSEVTCATVDGDFKVVRIPADVRLMLEEGAARFAAAAAGGGDKS